MANKKTFKELIRESLNQIEETIDRAPEECKKYDEQAKKLIKEAIQLKKSESGKKYNKIEPFIYK